MIKRFAVLAAAVLLSCLTASAQRYQNGLVDKIVALVGNDAIMLSDVEGEVQMMRVNGLVADRNARCEILEQAMISKLFLTQARLDSLVAPATEIQENLSQRFASITTQLGGEKAMEEYFNKSRYDLERIWRTAIEEQLLTQRMQQEVISKVPKMTPRDVKTFADTSAVEDMPVIPDQYKLRQIVLYPDKDSAATLVKERLLEIRERIVNGEKFTSLARLYSEDPGSATRGGELGMANKTVYWPAFSDAATALKVDQVSPIVETPDGFHIIQMIEKEGDMFNARHILIKPKYTADDRNKAFARLDSIRTLIVEDSLMTFEQAAWAFSEDFKTRTNGGMMVDENTGSAVFEKDQLKPNDYIVLRDMSIGEVSDPFESVDNEGRGNTIYKIIKLEEIIPSHVATYDGDFDILTTVANNRNANKAIDEFIAEKQKTTYIVIDPVFSGCNFTRQGWIK
ncbi:MAG: peptidylprolyl isomerase [Bacteroidales bacterium]|nr:peptidylprolyl isomerase [Bacteroidales bacterium]